MTGETVGAKAAWRRWAARVALAPRPETSAAVVTAVAAMLTGDATVLTYRAMPGEIDLAALDGLVHPDRLLVTRTPPTGPLTVHRADAPGERHRWGFDQPDATAPAVAPDLVDVALVPGVLFGRDGSRLGHGRGYYDELLAACRPDVIRIGITVSTSVVAGLPIDEHDVAMTHLATEGGLHTVQAPRR